MRIRSPLTDHSLYAEIRQGDHPAAGGKIRRDRPPRGSQRTPANRRIFRLALMLVLVLLLMQQASDPDVYRRFFGAMGAPLDAVPSESHRPPGPERSHISEAEAIESLQVAPGAPQTGTPLAGTVERVDDETRRRLSASLAALRRGEEPHEVVEGETWDRLVQTVAEAAAKEGEINPETLAAALRSPGSPDAKALLQRLQAGLDASYWTTVSDATIWQPGDALAFYRLLEKGGQFEEPPTRVGYLSLSDQPLVYRGRPVAIEGDVARVEPQRAPANEFGVEDYWLVWLRPADGSDRPVMVYAAEISAGLKQLTGRPRINDGLEVTAEGVFLKRHLYLSQRGSELAPVIVGSVTAAGASDVVVAVTADVGEESPWRWAMLLIIAVVVGVGFTLWAAWHTARIGIWRRKTRLRGLPSPQPFLESLKKSV